MISRLHFRAVVWFALGIFAWSAVTNVALLCGSTPTFSALTYVVSFLGFVAAIYALRHEKQWCAADGGSDWRTDE